MVDIVLVVIFWDYVFRQEYRKGTMKPVMRVTHWAVLMLGNGLVRVEIQTGIA